MKRTMTKCLLALGLLSLPLLGQSQSIADLARKAEEKQNPLSVYSFVGDCANGLYIVGVEDADRFGAIVYGLADTDGSVYISPKYDGLWVAKEGYQYKDNAYKCELKGKYGFIDSHGNVLLPVVYNGLDNMGYYRWLTVRGGKQGVVELKSASSIKEILPCKFDKIEKSGQYFLLSESGKKGLADSEGLMVIPVKYDDVGPFSSADLAWVVSNRLRGVYKRKGEEVQPCIIKDVFTYNSDGAKQLLNFGKYPGWNADCVYVECESGIGIIDGHSCKTLIPPSHGYISPFAGGKALCQDNGKWGIVSSSNDVVQAAVFDEMLIGGKQVRPYDVPPQLFKDNIYVRKDSLWGLLNADGKLAVEVKYDSLGLWHDSLMIAKQNGKYGYVGINGKMATPFLFASASDFSEGLAAVQTEDAKYFFIDTTGKMAIKPHKYDRVGKFANGRCQVWHKDKTWLIDREGKKVKDAAQKSEDTEQSREKPKNNSSFGTILRKAWNNATTRTRMTITRP